MAISAATAKVLTRFLEDPAGEHYGFGLIRDTGVKAGSLYPILDRLLQAGWIERQDEDIDESVEGRPRRRLYRLTPNGSVEARRAVEEFFRQLKAPSWLAGTEGV